MHRRARENPSGPGTNRFDADFCKICSRIDQMFATCSLRYYFSQVVWEFSQGTVTLRGRVPTERLSNVLERMLSEVVGVESVENHLHANLC